MDGLHVTLRFLGATPPGPDPARSGRRSGRPPSATQPFEVVLAGAGAFPEGRRPRTLWLGIQRGADELADLAAGLVAPLARAGLAAR